MKARSREKGPDGHRPLSIDIAHPEQKGKDSAN